MNEPSLLWEISCIGNPKSYLFGTMHVKDERAYEHIKKATKALYQCTHFKTEINLEEAKHKMQPSSYLLSNNYTIQQLLGQKKFVKIHDILHKSIGLDLNDYDRLLPLIVVNRLSELVLNEDNHQALDAYLWSEATKLKLVCDGLETLEEQLSLLESLSVEVQLKMLKEIAKNIPKFKKSIEQLGNLYVNEDIIQLYHKTKKSLGILRQDLLYNRNELMADRIFNNKSLSCFYAIGAAHLAGNKGVLAKLKRKGLKLKAI